MVQTSKLNSKFHFKTFPPNREMLLKILISFYSLICGFAFCTILCPGSPESSYGFGQLSCSRPVCLVAGGGGLFPSPDPTSYFVCVGHDWSVEMRCAPGSCFSLKYQGCVHPRDWTDICDRSEESIGNPSATLSTDSTFPAVIIPAEDETRTTTAFDWESTTTGTSTISKNDLYQHCRPIVSNEEECLVIVSNPSLD